MIKTKIAPCSAHADSPPEAGEWVDPWNCIQGGKPAHLPLRRLDREAPKADLLKEGERRPDRFTGTEWPFLYRFYDAGRRPLYFGITSTNATRLEAHRKGAEWWPMAEFIAVSVYPSYLSVQAAERAAIRHEQPRCNKRDRRGPAYVRLHVDGPAEEAAALLFRDASPVFLAELAELLASPARFPRPEPPPPARFADEA
ncbi:GIY-YIG nuclease family protein [Streptomyces sp. NPDC126510]|uniref:GIY-YIG nuclease family protein n=1 Tax=Streptomyces sp. NPDC126510 TaxID=3155317 RepID=UPI00331E5FB0